MIAVGLLLEEEEEISTATGNGEASKERERKICEEGVRASRVTDKRLRE